MLLAIDVGNTNINVGIFDGEKLIGRFDFHDIPAKYFQKANKAVIVSVCPTKLKTVLATLRKTSYTGKIYMIGKDIKVPLKSKYNPKEIGQDRLVTAYAATRLYGKPVLIIDFGTAMTFDIVSTENVYLGGLILPGVKMSLESLHKNTALLPEVTLRKAKGFIARDTETSIRNGLIYGYSHICEGLISRFRKDFVNLKIVATGGNAKLISNYTPLIENVDGDLSLKGLSLISEH